MHKRNKIRVRTLLQRLLRNSYRHGAETISLLPLYGRTNRGESTWKEKESFGDEKSERKGCRDCRWKVEEIGNGIGNGCICVNRFQIWFVESCEMQWTEKTVNKRSEDDFGGMDPSSILRFDPQRTAEREARNPSTTVLPLLSRYPYQYSLFNRTCIQLLDFSSNSTQYRITKQQESYRHH